MLSNNTSAIDVGEGRPVPWVAIYSLRLAGSLAIVSNAFILLCALHLRRKFRSRDYWLQIVILAGIDIFNGTVSLLLSILTFDTNYIRCGFLLCLYMFSQINTLCAICCICVNRFRCLKNMDKTGSGILCRQELGTAVLSVVSLLYCALPYFIWDLTEFEHKNCTAPVLFGDSNGPYLLHTCTGVCVPLIVINILYGLCVHKLWKSRNSVAPENIAYLQTSTVSCKYDKDAVSRKNKQNADNFDKLTNSGQSSSQETGQTSLSICGLTKQVGQDTPQQQTSSHENRHIFKKRRAAQSRAIKLLGIILILADVATIIPFSVLLRQGLIDVIAGKTSKGSGNSIGVTCLSINAFVDAFVYGLCSREIRNFLKETLSSLWRSVMRRF